MDNAKIAKGLSTFLPSVFTKKNNYHQVLNEINLNKEIGQSTEGPM